MSARRRITLRVDDPLAPAPGTAARAAIAEDTDDAEAAPEQSAHKHNGTTPKASAGRHAVAPGSNGKRARTVGSRRRPASGEGIGGPGGRAWPKSDAVGRGADDGARSDDAGACRSWTGATRAASYRLPGELLEELAARAAALQLPVGLIVTAALAHILDAPGEVIETLVDRADDARTKGRREARRAFADDTQTPTRLAASRF
jgi:hypothetical protein